MKKLSLTDRVILIGAWVITIGLTSVVIGQYVIKKTGWPPL